MGDDFTAAVDYFFRSSHMPRCINTTRIALIPKVGNPDHLHDYRPISCCTVIYKCISKIIAKRIQSSLASVISRSQSAFLPGRNISDAIFLVQELMHNYHRTLGSPRCAIKVDLRKAFDTIQWNFILQALDSINIPPPVINWIRVCITSPFFTISLNGTDHGFFPASRGLRQGDPLSPLLFVFAMEGLNGIIQQATLSPDFKYHWRCKDPVITHQGFADDLILFCRADPNSVQILKGALDKFMHLSGLSINLTKSSVFAAGVDNQMRATIVAILGIQENDCPLSYLGVPLIYTKLSQADCLPLLERIKSRIKLWTTATLSYAGRLQLITSVLFSMQVYWATKFILPALTIAKMESLLSAFLWKGVSLSTKGAKVAWKQLCFPKSEGGLGIKRLKTWNQAAAINHIWTLLTDKDSLWVAWVHKHLLKGRPFWQVTIPSNPSWIWRKILQAREQCRGGFRVKMGNGQNTFLWYDYWLPNGIRPIDILPQRTLSSSTLPWTAKVADIIVNDRWNFPQEARLFQSLWSRINFQPRVSVPDLVTWHGSSSGRFTIASAWNSIRSRKPVNILHKVLWHPLHIPRHSFMLWLAAQGRLRTSDRLPVTSIDDQNCKLCTNLPESHDHLFFSCSFSSQVWKLIQDRSHKQWPALPWNGLLDWTARRYKDARSIDDFIGPLIFAGTVYHVWQERNS